MPPETLPIVNTTPAVTAPKVDTVPSLAKDREKLMKRVAEDTATLAIINNKLAVMLGIAPAADEAAAE